MLQNEPKILYVTGADAGYFTVLSPLLLSFEVFSPQAQLFVCDFGLTQEQCRFLAAKGQLLPIPTHLPKDLHPFYYKASLYHYTRLHDFDALVWVDGDTLITDDIHKKVIKKVAEMAAEGSVVAACADTTGTIGDFLRRFDGVNSGIVPFAQALDKQNISTAHPYLNSAVFIIRKRDFLRTWAKEAFEIDHHLLFEQNLFNLLAYGRFAPMTLLDAKVWNVHDLLLDQLSLQSQSGTSKAPFLVYLGDKRTVVLHATSFQGRAAKRQFVKIPLQNGTISGELRVALNPEVGPLFQTLANLYLHQNRGLLQSCGVLEPLSSFRSENSIPEAAHVM
ncbi:hypothetical protein ACQZV8_09625 [Magnetococcales bacterium HHB-1]